MGIPSFYRHLLRRFPHIVAKGAGPRPDWLCLDFNCAMYYVLRKMPAYAPDKQKAWESEFADAIASYMSELVTVAQPCIGVFVSCDGVVCAAKRRQQRLRRFKGPWTAAAEAEVRRQAGGATTDAERWDQNALTPGSAFMGFLGGVLTERGERLGARLGLDFRVSTTSEPGEGEHKLLAHMRGLDPGLSCTIYGLDADLILLAMLLHVDKGGDVRLLREAQEFEAGREGEWRCLSVPALIQAMLRRASPDQVRDFVAGMSLLGNDFLPRSLTRTVRNDGIPQLIRGLERIWIRGSRLVGVDGQIQRDGLLALVTDWAETEAGDIFASAKNAVRDSHRHAGIGADPEETALREWNSQPAHWATLARLLDRNGALRNGWGEIYCRDWHAGDSAAYCAGVAWVWDYYSGKSVDQGWMFEEHLPPLWGHVGGYLSGLSTGSTIAAPPVKYPTSLPEWVHLLSVLPADSVKTLLPKKTAVLQTASWYWPTGWKWFDVGRTQMWECEPMIPVIPEQVLREWSTVMK